MHTRHDEFMELIRPYSAKVLAEAAGRTRQVAHAWKTRESLPDVAALPGLALMMRVDLGDLTRMVAEASDERAARRLAPTA